MKEGYISLLGKKIRHDTIIVRLNADLVNLSKDANIIKAKQQGTNQEQSIWKDACQYELNV